MTTSAVARTWKKLLKHTSNLFSIPRVTNSLLASVAGLGVQVHEVADEVLGRVGDIVPVRGVKLVVPSHDLLEELSVVVMVEGRVTTEPGGEKERSWFVTAQRPASLHLLHTSL